MEWRPKEPLLKKRGNERAAQSEGVFAEGSTGASITLLCSAAIGAGVLALPYGVSTIGVFPAAVLFAVAGAAAFVSNMIIFQCAQDTGLSSYGELMTGILGSRGAIVLDFFVTLEGLAAVSTYLVFIMDYVPQVCALAGEDAWCTDRGAVLKATVAIVWPLSCLKGLSALRYVSTCSLATICFTTVVVVLRAPSCFALLEQPLGEAVTKVNFTIDSSQALSMACFAFMTHTNTPEIAAAMRRPTRERSRQVVLAHTALMWFVYCVIAVCGFLSFLDTISQDFLTNYDLNDPLVVACRSFLSLSLVFACPINMFPSMQALFNILEGMRTTKATDESDTLYASHHVRVPVTTCCFAVVVGVAARTPHVADMVSAISVFLSAPLMFLFPAVMYRTILGQKGPAVPTFLVLLTLALVAAEICRMAN